MNEPLHDRVRAWWDEDAATYDASLGHALADPVERAAWRAVLRRCLPPAPARVLDVGAGTGALTLLAAELGYEVTAVDLSEGMLALARAKADDAGLDVTFVVGTAEDPPSGPFDVVVERHVLWTVAEPTVALAAWRARMTPEGRLAIFEGSWAGDGPFVAARDAVERALRRAMGAEHDDHHGPYPEDVIERLPLRAVAGPAPFLSAIQAAGWRRPWIARLRDVEWAIEQREPWPLGALARRPRYALMADA